MVLVLGLENMAPVCANSSLNPLCLLAFIYFKFVGALGVSKLAMKQGASLPSNTTQSKVYSEACLGRIFLVALAWGMDNHAALPGTGGFSGKTFSFKLGES